MKGPEIAPSILAADFGNMREVVRKLEQYGADRIHIDVMDGHFVPNITFGPALIEAIRPATKLPFETHLMIDKPDRYIKRFTDAGSDTLIVHYEAEHNMLKSIRQIRSLGKEPGIAINPGTRIESAVKFLKYCDMLLVMSVNPGFGGQGFIPSVLPKITKAREHAKRNGYRIRIGIDGGINLKTGALAVEAGADELIAGTSIFCNGSIRKSILKFRKL